MKFLNDNKSQKPLWMLLIYTVLTMYYFGTVVMTFFVCYPQFQKVHEHFILLMQVFNSHMISVCYLPAFMMLVSSFLPLLFPHKAFPKPAIFISIAFALISVATTFFVVLPVHQLLPSVGFNESLVQKLTTICIWFQIIPAGIQVLIVMGVVNRLLGDTRPLARWLFIVVLFLEFFTWGTSFVDEFVNFPVYLTVGAKDWLGYRTGIPMSVFFGVFLIPGFLPLLLLIPTFWHRPKGIPRRLVTIALLSILWIFVITATYFVPHIQAPLDKGYSEPLIRDILTYSFPLRGTAGLTLFITMALMLFKAALYANENNKITA
jgi:hypothetical protein